MDRNAGAGWPEPQRKELEEVKEQLRAHNNRWEEKKSDGQLKRVDIDYPAPLEEAVLNWTERVQSLFPPLALEVRRSAFQFVRLEEAAIAKNFREKLVKSRFSRPPLSATFLAEISNGGRCLVINSIRETSRRILRLLVKDDCAGSSRFAQKVNSYWEDNPERFQARFYSRVRLKQNVFASLIDWLPWTGWESGIDARPALCVGVQRILAHLARRDEAGDTSSQLQAGSLVARYLILWRPSVSTQKIVSACSMRHRVRIQSNCLYIGRRHPGRTRDVGDVQPRRTVLGSLTILTDSGPIKLGAVLEGEGSNLCGQRPREQMHGVLDHFGYQVPSSPRAESARIVRDEVEGTTEPIFLSSMC
jgi:hypothetical protein